MLKIYRAHNLRGKIALQDHIDFEYGRFYTGLHGFGDVLSGNLSCKTANYEYQSLVAYEKYLKKIETNDGYVENFLLYNPLSYESLEEKFKNISKNSKTYEEYGLNEEGILLFTNSINIKYEDSNLVKRIFGRFPDTGMYLLKPDASIIMTPSFGDKIEEKYEVLQSKTLGKQLVLNKMNRKL